MQIFVQLFCLLLVAPPHAALLVILAMLWVSPFLLTTVRLFRDPVIKQSSCGTPLEFASIPFRYVEYFYLGCSLEPCFDDICKTCCRLEVNVIFAIKDITEYSVPSVQYCRILQSLTSLVMYDFLQTSWCVMFKTLCNEHDLF